MTVCKRRKRPQRIKGKTMSTITFFNPKGGSGKSTTALIVATELHSAGASVVMIDGDPNENLYRWAQKRGMPVIDTGAFECKNIQDAADALENHATGRFIALKNTNSQQLPFWIAAADAKYDAVVVDPEGTANSWVVAAVGSSDLVIVPLRPSPLDAEQMIRAVREILSQEITLRRKINYVTMFTCMPTLPTKDEKEIRRHILNQGYPMLNAALIERAVYRAMHRDKKMLSEMNEKEHSNLKTARRNASELVEEILVRIQTASEAA